VRHAGRGDLTAIAETDERTAKVAELDKTAKVAKEEFGRYEEDSGARLETLKKQLDETQTLLKEVEANVPANVRSSFDRIVKGRGWTPSRRWRTAAAAPAGRKSSPSSTTSC